MPNQYRTQHHSRGSGRGRFGRPDQWALSTHVDNPSNYTVAIIRSCGHWNEGASIELCHRARRGRNCDVDVSTALAPFVFMGICVYAPDVIANEITQLPIIVIHEHACWVDSMHEEYCLRQVSPVQPRQPWSWTPVSYGVNGSFGLAIDFKRRARFSQQNERRIRTFIELEPRARLFKRNHVKIGLFADTQLSADRERWYYFATRVAYILHMNLFLSWFGSIHEMICTLGDPIFLSHLVSNIIFPASGLCDGPSLCQGSLRLFLWLWTILAQFILELGWNRCGTFNFKEC